MFRLWDLQDNRHTFCVYRHVSEASEAMMKFDPHVQHKDFRVEKTSHKHERYQNAIFCYLHTNPNLIESGTLLMREVG